MTDTELADKLLEVSFGNRESICKASRCLDLVDLFSGQEFSTSPGVDYVYMMDGVSPAELFHLLKTATFVTGCGVKRDFVPSKDTALCFELDGELTLFETKACANEYIASRIGMDDILERVDDKQLEQLGRAFGFLKDGEQIEWSCGEENA